jgi:hypothetical protein
MEQVGYQFPGDPAVGREARSFPEEVDDPVLFVCDRDLRMGVHDPLQQGRSGPRTAHEKDVRVLARRLARIVSRFS